MTLDQFIRINQILPADAIILNKKFFGMLDHYVIYLGIDRGQHGFVANYTEGVKIIPNNELQQFLQVLLPTSIDRYPGPQHLRRNAVQRALSRVGEKAYTLFHNNCEHFKNWVHYGKEKSHQVEKIGKVLAMSGLTLTALGAENKNDTLKWVGIFSTIIGGIAIFADKATEENNKNR